MGDSVAYKSSIKNSKVYAVEASKEFPENEEKATFHGIDYTNFAISDISGEFVDFFPSEICLGKSHPYSGSILRPITEKMLTLSLSFKEAYQVKTITLDDFCKLKHIEPDFIHMDVQGAEYKILKNTKIRPKGIVIEICALDQYETGITYSDIENLLDEMGYEIHYRDKYDAYYILRTSKH